MCWTRFLRHFVSGNRTFHVKLGRDKFNNVAVGLNCESDCVFNSIGTPPDPPVCQTDESVCSVPRTSARMGTEGTSGFKKRRKKDLGAAFPGFVDGSAADRNPPIQDIGFGKRGGIPRYAYKNRDARIGCYSP